MSEQPTPATTAATGRKRILFVDDEQAILQALRSMFRRQRQSWDMVFALGGDAAIAELAKGSFDAIVSDMRMPGIDGVALLERVKAEHPSTSRIVLSGHAEPDAVARVLPLAHQFLAKPCSVASLRGVVERACQLTDILDHEGIRRVLGGLASLPSAPHVYAELTHAHRRGDVSIDELAAIIASDAAMSVKVLQLVNSSFFGNARAMSSVTEAVHCLGREVVAGAALVTRLFATMDPALVERFSLDRIQHRSLRVARLGQRFLVEAEMDDRSDEVFTTALVHDIGRIIMAVALPDQLTALQAVLRDRSRPLQVVERELLGVSHAEIGAYLLALWGLPAPIVDTVRFHHEPGRLPEGAPGAVLAALHVADQLVEPHGEAPAFDLEFLERAGLAHHLPRWQAMSVDDRPPSS